MSKHWRHFQRRLGYITTILLRIISGPHVQEIDATLATYLHWGQCSRAKWLECEFVARWVLRILAVCEITTVSVTEDCTGWAKKTDCFSDLITLWRLVQERRAVCQNFRNFIEKKVQNSHFNELKYSLPNLLKSSQQLKLCYIWPEHMDFTQFTLTYSETTVIFPQS